jgi:hypothetical protein
MAEVGETADDTVVAPSRVLSRHAYDQSFNCGRKGRAARIRATFGTVEFLGNQPAVPRHDGIWKSDGSDLLKVLATQPLADLSQSRAFWIGKAQAWRQM